MRNLITRLRRRLTPPAEKLKGCEQPQLVNPIFRGNLISDSLDYTTPVQQISSDAGSDFSDVAETLYGVNKRARWVAEAVSKFDNPDILDVGCGTGELLAIPIARRGYRVTGTDFHLPSIEHARAVAGSD